MEEKIYSRANKLNFLKILKLSVTDLFSSHFLAKQLAVRDIKAQYRQSFLGIFWMFITPVFTALVWVFLSTSGTVKLSDTGVAYPVYVFIGTLVWSIITESINTPKNSTQGSMSIIAKINFPKEALILTGIYKLLFNSLVKLVLLILFLFVYDIGFHVSQLYFPLIIMGSVFFGITLGLLITPISLIYHDISKVVSIGLTFLMYVTPVVYTIPSANSAMKILMTINPITPFIMTTRESLTGLDFTFMESFFWTLLLIIPVFFFALIIYRISIPIIIERHGA
ncbi:ABC transporter permease [Flavobacteriaceae bacterium]|nr:ABC transporter permease [Flavobacteriaceae bacterium]